jgi:hypothetical protein
VERWWLYSPLSLHTLDRDEVGDLSQLLEGRFDRASLADRDRHRRDATIRRHEPSAPPLPIEDPIDAKKHRRRVGTVTMKRIDGA